MRGFFIPRFAAPISWNSFGKGATMSQTSEGLRAADEGPRTFASAIAICLSGYVKFSGRAPRSEYWYFVLFTIIVSVVLNIIDAIIFGIGHGILSTIASLVLFLLGLPRAQTVLGQIRST